MVEMKYKPTTHKETDVLPKQCIILFVKRIEPTNLKENISDNKKNCGRNLPIYGLNCKKQNNIQNENKIINFRITKLKLQGTSKLCPSVWIK